MEPGRIVGDRFEIERRVAAGGLSSVYRGRDVSSGEVIAVKLLHAGEAQEHGDRFRREAWILEELDHPGVVRHIAHGELDDGGAYIAMEWLEGETLSRRLSQTGLTMTESVQVVAKVAEILAFVHARGILHRDIKPANLVLVDGDLGRPRLIDFGISRPIVGTDITGQGVMLGTLGYMAPEQARGTRGLDTRADLFGLGAMLVKCLTGLPPFVGDDAIAILAKMLFEEAPRARALRPEIPAALDDLVTRMMARDPRERPADAGVVAAELLSLVPSTTAEGGAARDPSAHADALTRGEQRLVSVVAGAAGAEIEEESTIVDGTWQGMKSLGSRLRGTLAPFGAEIETLPNGVLVVTFAGQKSAVDQAIRAARCALAIRKAAPDVPLVVATGRAVVGERLPQGDAVDRAVKMLKVHSGAEIDVDAAGAGKPQAIRVDEVTCGLLDDRFQVRTDPAGIELVSDRADASGERTLLGRVTSCVGRERELAQLEGIFAECVADDVPRAVLVTAAAGIGKSRVRHEFVRMLQHRGAPAEVWLARGDPMRAGSPFGMLSQIIRLAAGALEGEAPRVQREKVRARVGKLVPAKDRARVTQFLCEIIGVTSEVDDLQLRAARQDASLMNDQMRRALEEWFFAESGERPIAIVFEDLHWGDLPSVKHVDALLRALHDRPLFVLALARPEVDDLFPGLWAEREVTRLPLPGLSKKASEKLVRQVLGDTTDDGVVARIVSQAHGNAFFLEELIRGEAEGRGEAPPETILSMVESRLFALEPDARRVLRAASVFGQAFWAGGVAALLSGGGEEAGVAAWLDELCDRELVTRREGPRFRGEDEMVFRHGIVREAAYGMLKDKDRQLGHRLAAEWLVGVGETEAIVLAEHFERAGEPGRAISYYRRAAAQALEGNDLEAALRSAARGIACGADGELLGRLLVRKAEAHRWRGENALAEASAIRAMELLERGSRRWFFAAGEAVEASARLGNTASLHRSTDELCDVSVSREPTAPIAIALTRAAVVLLQAGNYPAADDLLAFLERAGPVLENDALASGHVLRVRAYRALVAGDPAESLALFERAIGDLDRAGDVRAVCRHRVSMGSVCATLGDLARAEELLLEGLRDAEKMGLVAVIAGAWHNLGFVIAGLGRHDEGLVLERRAVEAFDAQGDRRMAAASRLYCAKILLAAGRLPEARADAAAAVEAAEVVPPVRVMALSVLAHAALLLGRPQEAEQTAGEAISLLDSLGGLEEGEAYTRLVQIDAFDALGKTDEAKAALEIARDRLLAHAEKIQDTGHRARFLAFVAEHARTMEMVGARLA